MPGDITVGIIVAGRIDVPVTRAQLVGLGGGYPGPPVLSIILYTFPSGPVITSPTLYTVVLL